jgi:hypothetical protein
MRKLKLFFEKFSQAFTACGICMVQGDLTVFTFNHAMVASQTGIFTGLAIVVASLFDFAENQKNIAYIWLTGIFTMIADIAIHPSHFGVAWTEAVVTGIGAMLIAVIYNKIRKAN